MPVSYKVKGGPAIFMLIFGAIWLSTTASLVMNFLTLGMVHHSFGNGLSLVFVLIFSLFPLSGLVAIILGIRRMVMPLLILDERGVTIKKMFKTYQFDWAELQSIIYFKKKYLFFRRRGFAYREAYDFLTFHPANRPPVEVEISFLDHSMPLLINQLRERAPQFHDYSGQ